MAMVQAKILSQHFVDFPKPKLAKNLFKRSHVTFRRRLSAIFRHQLKRVPGVWETWDFDFWQLYTTPRYPIGKKTRQIGLRKLGLAEVTFWSTYDKQKKNVKKIKPGLYFYIFGKPCLWFRDSVILGQGSKCLKVSFSSKNDQNFKNSTFLVASWAKSTKRTIKKIWG